MNAVSVDDKFSLIIPKEYKGNAVLCVVPIYPRLQGKYHSFVMLSIQKVIMFFRSTSEDSLQIL